MNRIGIDLDYANPPSVIELKRKILKEQKQNGLTQVLVFQTRHGYHLELIYDRDISAEENFQIREQYGDCKKRMEYSKKRYELIGGGYDILFQMKEGVWRRRVWDEIESQNQK
ncbi:MAG TPA: hypothetical protein ENH14_01825 [candidate division WOR-3 bacterium]|uniref:Uncharacterized protein n=1 Tax=candidate division WOR-3 bacterium TaxID=2052148 RepID=A0A7V0Q5R6_UNCW3|nr:hypothetical protein [candidate division WOR-3 bacterium]